MAFSESKYIFKPEKYDAETWIYLGRWLVVATAVFFIGLYPELAGNYLIESWSLIASVSVYNIIVTFFIARRPNYPKYLPYTLTVLDSFFITLIVYFTGGALSTFYYLYFMVIASVAMRFDLKKTTLAAIFNSVLYFSVVFIVGEFGGKFVVEMISRLLFFFFTAIFTGYISERGSRSDVHLATLAGISQLSQNFSNIDKLIKIVIESTLSFLGFEVRALAFLDLGTKNRCWKIKKCKDEKCPAYGKYDQKCWISMRLEEGIERTEDILRESKHCLKCEVMQSEKLKIAYYSGIDSKKVIRRSLPVSKVPLIEAMGTDEKIILEHINKENKKNYFFDFDGFRVV
ncbi:MAG: hypothetical protein KAS39_02765, partial [Actinomycetia bacterium]|nr:hypothetical protein [Actinomycetes bacterium]